MKTLTTALFLLVFVTLPTFAADGVLNIKSAFNVKNTADRLESILSKKGMTVFNRIKHSENAAEVGIELRETELILFGNPKVGSPLMKCQQSAAIDLPQKAVVWKDDKNTVWISCNDPKYIEKRHQIQGCEKVTSKIQKALANITKAASVKP